MSRQWQFQTMMIEHQRRLRRRYRHRRFIRFAFLLTLIEEEEDSAQEKNQVSGFRSRLNQEGLRRRDRRIPRSALQPPRMSSWSVLFSSGNDQALITVCGVDHVVFHELEEKFTPIFDRYTPYGRRGESDTNNLCITQLMPSERRGRKRLVTSNMCLGLTLAWTRTRGAHWLLSMIFGMTANTVSMWLRFGIQHLLVSLLKEYENAAVRLPTHEKIQAYKNAIRRKYPALDDCYAVCDGLKLMLQQAGDHLIQNRFYNGWTHDHYMTNLFVFVPDGTICACALNAPGSIHDSQLAEWGQVYTKLEKTFDETGGKVVMDSAFSKGNYPYIVKSGQELPLQSTRREVLVSYQATSCRQAAEWGMHALQGSFPRLKDRLPYEENGERRIMLTFVTLLYNFRARKVGMNQILNTHMPELSRDANFLLNITTTVDDT